MGEFDLNLSTRPFRAEQLKTLLLTIALVALGLVSVWQVLAFSDYSTQVAGIRTSVRTAEVESTALGRRLADLESRLGRPEVAAKLAEIEYLNDIIARKSFSWSGIFATLEELLPDSVHLVSIRPEFTDDGGVVLRIDVRGRSMADIKELIETMQSSPVFGTVYVSTEEKKEVAPNVLTDLAVTLTVNYHAEKDGQ